MSRSNYRDAEALFIRLDRKTRQELSRLLERDKITFEEYMKRSVTAYGFIYPGPGYRPPVPAE